MQTSLTLLEALTRRFLADPALRRLRDIRFEDAGHGYDTFGLNPAWARAIVAVCAPLYEHYFRVTSHGAHHIPKSGPAIVTPNHSGVLPIDGLMLYSDVMRNTDPPRVLRPVADHFVPAMPMISTLFARGGMVGGSRGNVEELLRRGELLMIFPEGVPGIRKPFRDRYRLQPFRIGHAELAIRYGALVVPTAVIGAEEQLPLVVNLPIPMMGSPYLPVPLSPVLPVHYHIYYGEPLDLGAGLRPEDADDPAITEFAAARVQAAVQGLIDRGLSERAGVFR